jgi:hypothetical protein
METLNGIVSLSCDHLKLAISIDPVFDFIVSHSPSVSMKLLLSVSLGAILSGCTGKTPAAIVSTGVPSGTTTYHPSTLRSSDSTTPLSRTETQTKNANEMSSVSTVTTGQTHAPLVKTTTFAPMSEIVVSVITSASATETPTVSQTLSPTVAVTLSPTVAVTVIPTVAVTVIPTVAVTLSPTVAVTLSPTVAMTVSPTVPVTESPPSTTPATIQRVLSAEEILLFEDRQRVADQIGAAFETASRDWRTFSVILASIFVRQETLAWPSQVSYDDAVAFWISARGGDLLAISAMESNCNDQIMQFNSCKALMLLLSHIPLPTNNDDEKDRFFNTQNITAFIENQAENLTNRLQRANDRHNRRIIVPSHLSGQIDARRYSLIWGFGYKWGKRFPSLFTSSGGRHRSELLQIVTEHSIVVMNGAEAALGYYWGFGPWLNIVRNRALESFAHQLESSTNARFRRGISGVVYVGEAAGGHGLLAEMFSVINTAIVGPVFKPIDEESVFDHIDVDAGVTANQLRAVGKYFALCIIHERPTTLRLPVAFFKLLLGESVGYEDVAEIDRPRSNLYRDLGDANLNEADFNELLDNMGVVGEPLDGSGATEPLAFANRDEQISQAVRNLIIHSSPDAFTSISEGFNDILPREFLGLSADQLKTLVCATNRAIDPEDFLGAVEFVASGWPRHQHWMTERQEWFCQIVRGFTQDQMSNLLRFITGYQVLPNGGFAALGHIQIAAYNPTDRPFPMAHTCYKTLDMPQYDTMEQMREIFTNVVNTANFAGMDERR